MVEVLPVPEPGIYDDSCDEHAPNKRELSSYGQTRKRSKKQLGDANTSITHLWFRAELRSGSHSPHRQALQQAAQLVRPD